MSYQESRSLATAARDDKSFPTYRTRDTWGTRQIPATSRVRRQSGFAIIARVSLNSLESPLRFLESIQDDFHLPQWLEEYESWWQEEGQNISDAVDRAGTPWLRMFDQSGRRVDEILYSPDYWRMLKRGYQSGLLRRSFEEKTLSSAGLGIYVTSFYDPGLACPYTVSLSTLIPLLKYGDAEVQQRFAPKLL